MDRPIGVFDSGIGGLSVLRACRAIMPNENYIYLADKANMPYGTKSADRIIDCALACADILFSMNCKAVVAACNTATETAIDRMREMYGGETIVGLEPAIKPCLRALKRNEYAVAFVTEGTAASKKFRALTDGEKRIVVSPQPFLAELIENAEDIGALRPYVENMLAPYGDASAVALGCSHYSFVSSLVDEFYSGKVKIFDGACGAAARLESLLTEAGALNTDGRGSVRFYSTTKNDGRL